MARVLGRIRLSRNTEESTSEARQREIIESWAKMHQHQIVGWAVDLDVSGGLSPFMTPEFGDWLRRPQDWDITVAWKLDRLGRTLFGLNDLFRWFTENRKTLVCVEDHIDLSHWTGRLVATVIAGVAEGELENTKARTKASRAKLRELGRWHGGQVPFGYRAAKDEEGWGWEIVPEEAAYIRRMAQLVISGENASAVARWLNEQGVKPRRVDHWTFTAVIRILRARWPLGQSTHKGRVVVDDEGLPLQIAEPILDETTWHRVQQVLDGFSVKKKVNNGVGLLKDVAFCTCGEKLYLFVKRVDRGEKKYRYRYWRCSGKVKRKNECSLPNIPADDLEGFVAEQFLADLGPYERSEPVYDPGTGKDEELETVERAIQRLRKEADMGLYEDDEEGYFGRLKALMDRKRKLAGSESRPARWVRRGLGETYADAWERAGVEGRRELLLNAGVRVTARSKPFEANFWFPVDVVQEMVPDFEMP